MKKGNYFGIFLFVFWAIHFFYLTFNIYVPLNNTYQASSWDMLY